MGQSLAPSSWVILILCPRIPPPSLIWSIANRSAWIEPVSLMAIVPVALCNWPTVTSVSVMAMDPPAAAGPLSVGLAATVSELPLALLQPIMGGPKATRSPRRERRGRLLVVAF